ncbi:hypothetical protein C2I27_03245 [Priestia megaterium]|uniref:right-handed parallel beta-helix repeat-containing protein n=1 Tax=Priestia TaxID=2800373 RepID=UPI000D50A111|nr:right-handed parallel beta-helix repeat-containing protein [Priestia megaterium]PVC76052.1 hypothetical protein C2I27_03245 [Priestia megaterium]
MKRVFFITAVIILIVTLFKFNQGEYSFKNTPNSSDYSKKTNDSRDISENITLKVPNNFKTINQALDYLKNKRLLNNSTVTISISPGIYHEKEIVFNHPDGERIKIIGSATSGRKPNTNDNVLYPNAASRLNALKRYYRTVIQFEDTAGITTGSASIGYVSDILLVGNKRGNNAHGISINKKGTGLSNGTIKLGNVGIYGFHNAGISIKNGGTILSKKGGLIISDNLDGISVNEGGTVIAEKSIINNNQSVGVNIKYGGSVKINESYIANNGNRGLYILQGGTVVASKANISENSDIGVYILYGGNADLSASNINRNGSHGLEINYGGTANAYNALITNNKKGGITVDYGGEVIAEKAQILHNGDIGIAIAYNGSINAKMAAIDGNASFGVHGIYGGNFNLSKAFVGEKNNIKDKVKVKLKGNAFAYSEKPGNKSGRKSPNGSNGIGKSELVSSSFSPKYNTKGNGNAFIGDPK